MNEESKLRLIPLAGNRVASTQIINNAILNFMLMTFQRNDEMLDKFASEVYCYGPKSFIKQIKTKTGACDLDGSYGMLSSSIRSGEPGYMYSLSGYCYDKPGYKIWGNIGKMNTDIMKADTSADLAFVGRDTQYGVVSSDLTAVSADQTIELDPEIYKSTADSQSKYSPDYFARTVTANSYLVSADADQKPSNWKATLHQTFDTSYVDEAVKNYFNAHEQNRAGYWDEWGCLTHQMPNDDRFAKKVTVELSNFQSLKSNGYADAIDWYWHGQQDVVFQVSSPEYACLATNAVPDNKSYSGYELTHKKLNKSYAALLEEETKSLSCTFLLYKSGKFDLYLDIPNQTLYIPEVLSSKTKFANSTFSAKDATSGQEYSSNNNLSLMVFPNMKLANSASDVSFNVYKLDWNAKGAGFTISSKKFAGLAGTPSLIDATDTSQIPAGSMQAVPGYVKDAAGYVIVGAIDYTSQTLDAERIIGVKVADIFEKEGKSYVLSQYRDKQIGTEPTIQDEYPTYHVAVNNGDSTPKPTYQCTTLNGIGHAWQWTRTRMQFSYKSLVQTLLNEFISDPTHPWGKLDQASQYTVVVDSAVVNAKTMASNRYQIGADTAMYPESEVVQVDEQQMIIELFNSDNQTLRMTGRVIQPDA